MDDAEEGTEDGEIPREGSQQWEITSSIRNQIVVTEHHSDDDEDDAEIKTFIQFMLFLDLVYFV